MDGTSEETGDAAAGQSDTLADPAEEPAPGSLEAEQAALSGDSDSGGASTTETRRLDDEQAEIADEEVHETFDDGTNPLELEDTDYFFLGAFGRGVVIPGFIQTLFVEGGIDGFNPGVGLTFNWRRNNFNVIADVWWNNANAGGFFRANGDPVTDTERIDVNLQVIFINAQFLWSFPVVDWFAIELGFDIGVGIIYGDLVRSEAYADTPADAADGNFRTCTGPGDGTGGYCEPAAPDPCYNSSGGHYNCREPNWATEGGDTPIVFPWVTLPHVALRFKPIRQIQIRVDGGYGLYNFFFGGSVSYGF